MIPDGFEAPYVRVYFQGLELTDKITRLRYCFDEEDDDECELSIELEKREDVDKPEYQEGAQLEVIWGFIKGRVATKRKVWVNNPVPDFTRENIKLTLQCNEKGTTMKASSDNKVYKKKNLPQIAKEIADKHGLQGYVELTDEDFEGISVEPIPGEKTDVYLKRVNKIAYDKKYATVEPQIRKLPLATLYPDAPVNILANLEKESKTSPIAKEWLTTWKNASDIDKNRILEMFQSRKLFQVYDSIPQANRSDKQFLDSIAKRHQGGPFVVETRDDELIIKKRSFVKKPFICYEYGSSAGDLLEFKPQTKIRTRKGSGVGMGFSGWNPKNKTFFSGTTSTVDDGDPQLAKANKMLQDIKRIQKFGGGKTINQFLISRPFQPFIADINVSNKIDNAGDFTNRRMKVPVTVDDQVRALEKAIAEFTTKKEAARKEMYNSMGINPIDAYNQASNARKNAELKTNPASATVWGHPELTTGMIITISGVGRKYSGNYYTKKVTHEVQKSGYLVELEMARQGINIVPDSTYISAQESGKPVNTKVGDKEAEDKTKKVPVVENPDKLPTVKISDIIKAREQR